MSQTQQEQQQYQGQQFEGQGQQRQSHIFSTTWDHMSVPGAYVDEMGDLFRVPSEALSAGSSPLISRVSNRQRRLTRVSDNPYVGLQRAREIAANANIEPNF